MMDNEPANRPDLNILLNQLQVELVKVLMKNGKSKQAIDLIEKWGVRSPDLLFHACSVESTECAAYLIEQQPETVFYLSPQG